MKHIGHPVDVLLGPQSLTAVLIPPDPHHMVCIPHITCRYPLEHRNAQGSVPMCGGLLDIWREIQHMGEVSKHVKGTLHPPQHAETPQNIQMQMSMGTYRGCLNTWGHMNIEGAYKCMRCVQTYRGVYLHKCENMPTTKKGRTKP